MLNDFFKLNGPFKEFDTNDFFNQLKTSKDLRNILYKPNILVSPPNYSKFKIKNTTFNNVSFSKTTIRKMTFINCSFEDCLFIGTKIDNCEFHNCEFKNCNTYKIKITNTYVNPNNFLNCINKKEYSNIAVHLFQQLVNNSIDEGQSEFRRIAEYNFKKWKDQLIRNQYSNKKPYKISFWTFCKKYPLNFLYRHLFGYGLKVKNFVVTFIIVFFSAVIFNYLFWPNYGLISNNSSLSFFDKDSANITSSFYYTLDIMTKLVDSPFQTTTPFGIISVLIQSIVGFLLISALLTIILNRVVK